MRLDITDKKLLILLQKDSNQTVKSLAQQLGKTATPIFERIKKLEKEGLIKGYSARLNAKKIDFKYIYLNTPINQIFKNTMKNLLVNSKQLSFILLLFLFSWPFWKHVEVVVVVVGRSNSYY